jgi:dephospho-CoA kinase
MKVISIVGMAGAGKSTVARIFEENGFQKIRFGDVTEEEVRKRGFELNEKNERDVREQLRSEQGMAVYAKLNLPRIDYALKSSDVVVDGLYSWEEYILLKDSYGEDFKVVAVYTSPATRHRRLGIRIKRPLMVEEAACRDKAEMEKLNKGGPIAMADFTILNESSLEALENETRRFLMALR